MTHEYFNGHGTLGSSGADEFIASSDATVDIDSLRALLTILLTGLSFFSAGVVGAVKDLKSNAVPGVLGVFVDDPNEAKAPDPRPNAEEPPAVGEARAPGVNGELTALKGFLPPCDDVSPPKRLVAGAVRWEWSDFSLCWSDWDMDRESLLVLWVTSVAARKTGGGTRAAGSGQRAAGGRAYLERRVQRFSLLSIGSGVGAGCSSLRETTRSQARREVMSG